MSNNKWLKTVNEINRERFTIPPGWETKERVADQLQCDPSKVHDLLKPGIEVGRFERQDFSVWDDGRRMTVRVTCYRIAKQGAPADAIEKIEVDGAPTGKLTIEGRVKKCLAKHPDWDDIRVAKSCSCRVGLVRSLR